MNFATALAESFAVTPTRTTGLVIDTFDNWSGSTTSAMASTCVSRSDPSTRASVCFTPQTAPVLGAASSCPDSGPEPALASVCRVASTVA